MIDPAILVIQVNTQKIHTIPLLVDSKIVVHHINPDHTSLTITTTNHLRNLTEVPLMDLEIIVEILILDFEAQDHTVGHHHLL